MKRTYLYLVLVGLLASAVVLGGCGQPETETTPPQQETPETGTETPGTGEAPAGANVTIANFAFSPAEIEVKVGEAVTWTQEDSAPHTVKGDDFESEQLAAGDTYTRTFDEPGTYEYICGLHPQMTGTVTVTE